MGKKFVGLGGLKHFWTKAKTWIAGQITSEVTAKIAEIVANAPEDLDTLKEIADWIKTHANDASAMNTQINTNKNDIAALQTSVAGKADTGHKHSASDITSGVLPVAKGGTGVTTQANINKAFIRNLEVEDSNVTDGTEFVSSWASDNGFNETTEGAVNTPYKRKFIKVWNYIKDKIGSVLGLTKDNYGGTAAAILDYNRNTPIKVRWGGAGINSALWYPAFNADGSALEPINSPNIHVGTADNATTAGTATTAAMLGRSGNTGKPMTFNWSGQGGQPSWLWGGNDGRDMYVYNPSNFSVNTATTAYKIRIGNSNPSDGDIWIQ